PQPDEARAARRQGQARGDRGDAAPLSRSRPARRAAADGSRAGAAEGRHCGAGAAALPGTRGGARAGTWRHADRLARPAAGGGALPLETRPSAGLAVRPAKGRKGALAALAAALRGLPTPVVARIDEGALVLDLRCLDDEAAFAANLAGLMGAADALA